MIRRTHRTAVFALPMAMAAAALLVGPTPAEAKIKCQGPNQVISGNSPKPTPYCEAEYLAYVARTSYGVKTSGSRLRQNINHRAEVCRFVGYDSRVASICSIFRNDQDRGRKWS